MMEYDYRYNGAYFVTICVQERHEIFGRIARGQMVLSENGEAVTACIDKIEAVYPSVSVDEFAVMPNHVHMLLLFLDYQANPLLQVLVKQFKSAVTKRIGFSPWQEGAYVRVVFTNEGRHKIQNYIRQNPAHWPEDCFAPGSE